jgi:hypothetical protein
MAHDGAASIEGDVASSSFDLRMFASWTAGKATGVISSPGRPAVPGVRAIGQFVAVEAGDSSGALVPPLGAGFDVGALVPPLGDAIALASVGAAGKRSGLLGGGSVEEPALRAGAAGLIVAAPACPAARDSCRTRACCASVARVVGGSSPSI